MRPPQPSIPQSDSLHKPSKTSPFNPELFFTHSLIPHPIPSTTINPTYLCDSDQSTIPSDFIPQETPSDPITDYFLPFPRQLSLSKKEKLLPICITLISNFSSDSVVMDRIDNNDLAPIFIATKKKYKPVHLKTKPVIGNLPDKFRIIRNIIGNPLKDLPKLPTNPPKFQPTGRYTKEHQEKFDEANPRFLWPSERHLLHYFMMIHNDAFAWDTSGWGHFREDFFLPIDIPVIPHKPWVQQNMPIPPGMYNKLCKLVKQKLNTGVFEPSNSSYRSRWFCVVKKDGKLLHIVQSLEPLNQVMIAHSGVPPFTEQLVLLVLVLGHRTILRFWFLLIWFWFLLLLKRIQVLASSLLWFCLGDTQHFFAHSNVVSVLFSDTLCLSLLVSRCSRSVPILHVWLFCSSLSLGVWFLIPVSGCSVASFLVSD